MKVHIEEASTNSVAKPGTLILREGTLGPLKSTWKKGLYVCRTEKPPISSAQTRAWAEQIQKVETLLCVWTGWAAGVKRGVVSCPLMDRSWHHDNRSSKYIYPVTTFQILLSRCWCVWVQVRIVLDLMCFEGGNPSSAGFLSKRFVECGRVGSLHIGKKLVCRFLSWAQASNSGVFSRRVGNMVCISLLIENLPFIYIFLHSHHPYW